MRDREGGDTHRVDRKGCCAFKYLPLQTGLREGQLDSFGGSFRGVEFDRRIVALKAGHTSVVVAVVMGEEDSLQGVERDGGLFEAILQDAEGQAGIYEDAGFAVRDIHAVTFAAAC